MNVKDENVGSTNMLSPLVLTKRVTPQLGSPIRSGLFHQQSYSPSSRRYTPYGVPQSVGVASPGAPAKQSGIVRGLRRSCIPTLAEYQARLSKQVSAAIVPLSVQVAQTSQTVQQTGVLASQALQEAQLAKARTKQLKREVIDVMRAYMQQTKSSTQ